MDRNVRRAVRHLESRRAMVIGRGRGDAALATHYAWKARRMVGRGWPVWIVLEAYEFVLRGNPWMRFRRPPLDGPVHQSRALIRRDAT